jgi:hypothetical protein
MAKLSDSAHEPSDLTPATQSTDMWRGRLAEFLAANPRSGLTARGPSGVVTAPWGDESIEIELTEQVDNLVSALNALYLPPRFSAIWHRDSKDAEFVYGPVPVDEAHRSRSFEFRLGGQCTRCEFADPSARLLLVAEAARPARAPTETLYRNLPGLRAYVRMQERQPDSPLVRKSALASFWIRDVEWEEGRLVWLARHINFYMRYFDRKTPRILIHEDVPDPTGARPPAQYPMGDFPSVIVGRPLDPYLLGLWESALLAGDEFRRLLYSYQVLEYAAFYYIQDTTLHALKRIIASPDLQARLDEASRQILDATVESRMDEEARLVAVVKQLVDPAALWREIEPNLAYYSGEIEFDGGFALAPLLREGWGLDDFKSSWIPKFPDASRKLRNALVHSREARMAKVISPTRANYERIRPWSWLLLSTASQVIMYEAVLGPGKPGT